MICPRCLANSYGFDGTRSSRPVVIALRVHVQFHSLVMLDAHSMTFSRCRFRVLTALWSIRSRPWRGRNSVRILILTFSELHSGCVSLTMPDTQKVASCGKRRWCATFVTICAALVVCLRSVEAASPSFDCRKAQTPDEIAICQEPVLAHIDVLISEAFRRYDSEFRKKDEVGAAYLADRRACKSDVACIATIQARMLESLWSKPGLDRCMARSVRFTQTSTV